MKWVHNKKAIFSEELLLKFYSCFPFSKLTLVSV